MVSTITVLLVAAFTSMFLRPVSLLNPATKRKFLPSLCCSVRLQELERGLARSIFDDDGFRVGEIAIVRRPAVVRARPRR